jgi:hypothetical protein
MSGFVGQFACPYAVADFLCQYAEMTQNAVCVGDFGGIAIF